MKTLKAICTAATLAVALSVPAYAGDIYTPGFVNPGGTDISGETKPAPGEIDPSRVTSADDDSSFSTFADILWALASIY